MRRRHRLPFGAEILDGGGVRFRLWAPAHEAVALEVDGRTLAMRREKAGWFSLDVAQARAGSRYRYRVGDLAVPDPASRFQPDDVHAPSEVVDPAAHEWRDDDWKGRPWEEFVVYELHVGTFSQSGDFAGVERHLDHLAALGVTAVELMPVADFPGRRNWGYDGVLLFAPDSRYGRPEDLKRLIEAAHQRGLAVLLDVVYNHFGPDGNYLHAYAPQFFTDRHKTPWGAAINFDDEGSRNVRDFYVNNALYWIEEFHLDGLRFDAVHAVKDNSKPDIVAEIAATVRSKVTDRPIHLVLEDDGNRARYYERRDGKPVLHTAQWNDDIHHALRVMMTGESGGYYSDYADEPAERLSRALAEGFVYQGEASAYRDGERRGESSAHLPPGAFVSFIQNHDQVGNHAFGWRLPKLAKPEAIHAGAAVYLLSPQVPMIFQGEEWQAEQPFLFFCDFGPELAAAVRDGRRREFAKFPEFADESAREKIPDPTAAETFRRSVLDWSSLSRAPHAQWLERYRALLAIRAREIAPRLAGMGGHAGRATPLAEKALAVEWRLGDDSALTLFANFGEAPAPLQGAPRGRLLYAAGEKPGAAIPPLSASFFIDR